jgi:hypothetical protein
MTDKQKVETVTSRSRDRLSSLPTIPEVSVKAAAPARIYAFGWEGWFRLESVP